ncbi:hypothetical protein C6503_06680 [Candidatus Poribacteria bacterium]|nr:MAG: hypothetical protein C6503_06680 [Candidatus Poribacteria bacterium]
MKTLRNLSIFACLFLLVFIPLSAEAVPPPSPADGNYLALDGVDDHAVLDFETFGLLIPKDAEAFTFEAWIYPTTLPKKIDAVILSQQVRLYFRNLGPDGGFRLIGGAHLARAVGIAEMASGFLELSLNQWNHVAFQGGKGHKTRVIVNGSERVSKGGQGITLADDISHAEHPQDFTIGGFGKKIQSGIHGDHFWGHFSGYIDEVRISKVARYDAKKRNGFFTTLTKFKNDAKTVALWHFDEPSGTRKFSDTSGNAYHLIGKNGAKTDGEFAAVEAEGKLATIWGRLKR